MVNSIRQRHPEQGHTPTTTLLTLHHSSWGDDRDAVRLEVSPQSLEVGWRRFECKYVDRDLRLAMHKQREEPHIGADIEDNMGREASGTRKVTGWR